MEDYKYCVYSDAQGNTCVGYGNTKIVKNIIKEFETEEDLNKYLSLERECICGSTSKVSEMYHRKEEFNNKNVCSLECRKCFSPLITIKK